jgi:dTDP-4-dehydrorhamnose reductase
VRLVVTGAGGGLGRAFLADVRAHHDIHPFEHAALDIGDHGEVMRTVPPLRPDAVLNFAAFTDVDANESDPIRAVRDNAAGPQNLALAARTCGAAMVQISTDYVFDGSKVAPYDEIDRPAPLSVYGRAKLAGEEHVRTLVGEHLIVRVGHVFGGGADYLSSAVRALRAGESVGGIRDRVGTPTFVGDVAERLLPLLLSRRWGTYHLAGPDVRSWFEVLVRATEIGRLPGEVLPQRAAELGFLAPRPVNAALTSVYLGGVGIDPMPSLDDALARFMVVPAAG